MFQINKITIPAILIICFLGYTTYLGNIWYIHDDYSTFFVQRGDFPAVNMALDSIEWLEEKQSRFQPVRLFFVTFFTFYFPEESISYYLISFHLLNVLLLYLLLRGFKVSPIVSAVASMIFGLFGKVRLMDCTHVVMGGSGFITFLTLITFILLAEALGEEKHYRKVALIVFSYISYAALVFSYEIAYPLFLPLLTIFYFFPLDNSFLTNFKRNNALFLLPYVFLLVFYYVFFYGESGYSGAEVVFNISDILLRLKTYFIYTLTYDFSVVSVSWNLFVFLALYYFWLFYCFYIKNSGGCEIPYKNKTLIFCFVFYFSSLGLFVVNNWMTPTTVMVHHVYLITLGGSLIMTFFMFSIQGFLPVVLRKAYISILVFILAPIALSFGLMFNLQYAKDVAPRTESIKYMKDFLKSNVDSSKTEVILLKNFKDPYYMISDVDGAFLKWFNFTKKISSGRDIVSVKGNKVTYKGPLAFHYPDQRTYVADLNKTELFFLDGSRNKLLEYSDFINFKSGQNIFQTIDVFGNGTPLQLNKIEAILNNKSGRGDKIEVTFVNKDVMQFLQGKLHIKVNGINVEEKFSDIQNNSLLIYITRFTETCRHYFLEISVNKDISIRGPLKTLLIRN